MLPKGSYPAKFAVGTIVHIALRSILEGFYAVVPLAAISLVMARVPSVPAAEPRDVAIFSDSPHFYGAILVGVEPQKCLVVSSPRHIRAVIPCKDAAAFVTDKLHAPRHATLLVSFRSDADIPAWKATCSDLTAAGFRPTL